MKAEYTSSNGRLKFAVEGSTAKDLFSELASIQDVFDAETRCGCCQSDDLHYRVRNVQKFDFYELVCMGCYARFQFGQSKDLKNLFPKRRAEDGSKLPNGGWSKYEPNSATGQEEEVHQRTTTPRPQAEPANELAGWMARIDQQPEVQGPRIFALLMERMQAAGAKCEAEYDRISEAFNVKWAKKAPTAAAIKAAVCDLNAALMKHERIR